MSTRALGLSSLALTALLACGPPTGALPQDIDGQAQRFAEAVCAARSTCSCDDGRFESVTSCESELFTTFVNATEQGMSFDSDCLDSLLDSEAMTCSAWPWEDFDVGACRVLSRERGVGEPCEWHGELRPAFARDCVEGLFCLSGVCVEEITFDLELGEACEQGDAQPCVYGAYCGADDRCHARALLDEACTDFFGCETGLYCAGFGRDGVGVCSPHLESGAVCDPQDRLPCAPESPNPRLRGCQPVDGEYQCVDGMPGICYLTFPVSHP